jgi:dienelactone hydrolase
VSDSPFLDAFRDFLLAYDAGLPIEEQLLDSGSEDGLAYERLTYASIHNQRVPALLVAPETHTLPLPAVLLQHGGGDGKDERHIRLMLRRLAKAGFLAFAIDAPDHGERAPPGQTPLTPGQRRLFYRQRDNRVQNIVDLRRGVDLLQQREDVDPGRIGYWGISMGVSVGVPLLAVDHRILAACFVLGGAGRRPVPEGTDLRHVELTRQALDPVLLAPRLAPRTVLMLNGSEDRTVPPDAAGELFEALQEPKRIEWFPAGHSLTAGMIRASTRFFREVLSNGG